MHQERRHRPAKYSAPQPWGLYSKRLQRRRKKGSKILGCTEDGLLQITGASHLFEELRKHAAKPGLDLIIPDTNVKSQRMLSLAIYNIEEFTRTGGGHGLLSRGWLHHASACKIQGAGAWLNAIPDRPSLQMEPELFRTAVSKRLRVRFHPTAEARTCPQCGESLDCYGDHAVSCLCGGDVNIRHHRVRDTLANIHEEAGQTPQKEKAGLLPAKELAEKGLDPRDEDNPPPEPPEGLGGGGGPRQNRRPADIWVKNPKTRAAAQNGTGDEGTAYDIAVTSTLTPSVLSAYPSPKTSLEQLNKYADKKRAYCNTEEQCRAVGVTFQPLVFDSQGGGAGTKPHKPSWQRRPRP